jgi:predicted metalloendopeptidase
MSFTKFFELTSNKVDWLNLTNRIYKAVNSSVQLSPQELVIVLDIPYYKGVTQLLEKTPNRVIANYLGWMIAMNLGVYTLEKFRKNEFEFQKVNSGVEQQTELWRICCTYLEATLPYAVGRKYVDEHFTKKDKEEVRNILKLIIKNKICVQ